MGQICRRKGQEINAERKKCNKSWLCLKHVVSFHWISASIDFVSFYLITANRLFLLLLCSRNVNTNDIPTYRWQNRDTKSYITSPRPHGSKRHSQALNQATCLPVHACKHYGHCLSWIRTGRDLSLETAAISFLYFLPLDPCSFYSLSLYFSLSLTHVSLGPLVYMSRRPWLRWWHWRGAQKGICSWSKMWKQVTVSYNSP